MNILLTRLLGRERTQPPAAVRPVQSGASNEDDAAACCGWFDSSHELQHGLWVREHASPDEVANDLPLALWLELHLASGQRRSAA